MASNMEWDRNELKALLFSNPEVIKKTLERSRDFQKGKENYERLESARIPEPNLKPQGGPNYKPVNLKEQKQEALLQITDTYQQHNKELSKLVKNEVFKNAAKDDLAKIRQFDLQDLIDEKIKERNLDYNEATFTNRQINKYIKEHGIDPYKTRGIDPSNPRRTDKETPPIDKDLEKFKFPQMERAKSWEKNKKDMDLEP